MAGENVRRGIEHVRKQREKVQWLERGGRDAAQDRKVLDTAEDSLLLHMMAAGRGLCFAESPPRRSGLVNARQEQQTQLNKRTIGRVSK